MKDLRGKTGVITGGAGGIGFAMAEAFAGEGMNIVLGDIEPAALERARAALRAKGAQVAGVVCDVAKFGEVEALADAAWDAFGGAHVVVNNAGVSITGPTWQMTLDDWRWVMDVNLMGVVHGIKAFTPRLIAQGQPAHIVNTASEAAFLGIGHHAPYCASKAAVHAVSLSLHSEMEAQMTGIGVSVVCPGMVDTQIHRSWRNRPSGDTRWSLREREPEVAARTDEFQGRGVPPEDVAKATLAAVREGRFYVFNTPHWRDMIRNLRDRQSRGENPMVHTWGPDLRAGRNT